jgi:predicted alpha/beta-hydrolase family hydrolase
MPDVEDVQEVPTPRGPARLHVAGPAAGSPRLWLGHGAGGGVDTLDLVAARDAALALGWQTVRVEQPWRLAGKKVAEPPPRLDEAWRAVLAALPPAPAVLGGRSAGARVACRTADTPDQQVVGVLALAFPLVAPRGASRQAELDTPTVPRLVVQGDRDGFGLPVAAPGVQVVVVPGGDHSFRVRKAEGVSPSQVRAQILNAVQAWLATLV